MSRYFYAIIISLALSKGIFSQDIQLGFRWESNFMKSHSDTYTYTPEFVPDAAQINISYFPINDLGIEARLGAELSLENYTGFEYGLLTKYFLTQQSLKPYLLAGVMFHHNTSNYHGVMNPTNTFEKTFTLPSIGFGINPIGALNIEALYQFGMNKDLTGTLINTVYDKETFYTTKLDWVLKLGIGFSWSL